MREKKHVTREKERERVAQSHLKSEMKLGHITREETMKEREKNNQGAIAVS